MGCFHPCGLPLACRLDRGTLRAVAEVSEDIDFSAAIGQHGKKAK